MDDVHSWLKGLSSPDPWELQIELLTVLGRAHPLDSVVINWLRCGDTRPLAWALRGHKPLLPATLKFVGMMLDGAADDFVTYRLEAVRRDGKRGNARKPAIFSRDLMMASLVRILMDDDGLTYEAATQAVADVWHVSVKLVEAAYTKFPNQLDPNQLAD